MRRPLLIIFIILLIVCFIYTDININSQSYYNEDISIVGTVKYKKKKDKYDEYIVGNFLVRDYTKSKNIKVGSEIKLIGKLKNLNDMIYDNFNYGRYLKSIGYEGLIYIEKFNVLGKNKIYEIVYKMKDYMSNTFRYLYKSKSDLLNSVILGQREDLSQDENLMFSRSGTSHIIAISGLHTGILSAIIIFIIGRINKIYKLILLSIIMIFYSIMVGNSPSILRAIIGMIILYLSFFLDRKNDKISTLSFIGILLVANNPYIIYNISFQLSFLATLSIIYFYGFINNKLKVKMISLTLASNILTIPMIYYNFKGVPLLSVFSNIIIVVWI